MAVDKISEIFFLDLAIHDPETEAYEEVTRASSLPVSYHSPSREGMESLYKREEEVSIGGFLVLGSVASIYDGCPWQSAFHPWLESRVKKGIPTFGICYGHQLIASFFGAKVGSVAGGQKFTGLRKVKPIKETALGIKEQSLSILACHNEEVKELPQGMAVFAKSPEVEFEGFYHKDLPIFTLQTHPEARSDFYKKRGVLPCEENFADGRKVIRSFLDFTQNFL